MLAPGPYTGSASDPKPDFPGLQSTLSESCGVSIDTGSPGLWHDTIDVEGEDVSDVEA
jgi:hypothetical protein